MGVPCVACCLSRFLWEVSIFSLPSNEAAEYSSKVPLSLLFLNLPWKSLPIIKKHKFKGFNILEFEQEGIMFSGFYVQPQRLLFGWGFFSELLIVDFKLWFSDLHL